MFRFQHFSYLLYVVALTGKQSYPARAAFLWPEYQITDLVFVLLQQERPTPWWEAPRQLTPLEWYRAQSHGCFVGLMNKSRRQELDSPLGSQQSKFYSKVGELRNSWKIYLQDMQMVSALTAMTRVLVFTGTTRVLMFTGTTRVLMFTVTTRVLVFTGMTHVMVFNDTPRVVVLTGTTRVLVFTGTTRVLIFTDTTRMLMFTGMTRVLVWTDTTRVFLLLLLLLLLKSLGIPSIIISYRTGTYACFARAVTFQYGY